MGKNDELWAAVLGGLVGAAISAPKPEDKQDLETYRRLKQEIVLRQQQVGTLPNYSNLFSRPEYYNTFIEAYQMHLNGFYRGSVIISSAVIESLLREKYGDGQLYDLVEKAKADQLIGVMDYNLLHVVRSQRNDSVHNILQGVREEDSRIVLQIVIRVINTILTRQQNG